MSLGDEYASEIGLSCGGTIYLLVEPLDLQGGLTALYRRIAGEVAQGGAACLVRLLRAPDESLLVFEDGRSEGSLGDEALDRAARGQAFARNASRTEAIDKDEAFFEMHAPRPHLLVV